MKKLSVFIGIFLLFLVLSIKAQALGINYESGTYKANKMTIKLIGEDLSYSLDGEKYVKYKNKIRITENTTLYVKDGEEIKCYTYKLKPKIEIDYQEEEGKITISKDKGVNVYCSINEEKVFKYTEPIILEKDATIKYSILKDGCTPYRLTETYYVPSYIPLTERYENKFYYNQCNAEQKKIYKQFYEMTEKCKQANTTSNLSKGVKLSDIERAYWAFEMDNGHFPWLSHRFRYTYNVENDEYYTIEPIYREIKDEIKEKVEEKVKEIVREAEKYKTDREKVKYIHDIIINNCEYSTDGEYTRAADGVLLYGKAQCIGYSKAFMWLCQESGIPCICVSNEVHQWNMVYIEGKWYHVDVTYDDPIYRYPIKSYKYFLVDNIDEDNVTNKGLCLPTN